MRPSGIKFFRTQSPRHFEGGDWDQGGSCMRLRPLLPQQVSNMQTYDFERYSSLLNLNAFWILLYNEA